MKIRCDADGNQQKDVEIFHKELSFGSYSFSACCKDNCPENGNNDGVLPIVEMIWSGISHQFTTSFSCCPHAPATGKLLDNEITNWQSMMLKQTR